MWYTLGEAIKIFELAVRGESSACRGNAMSVDDDD